MTSVKFWCIKGQHHKTRKPIFILFLWRIFWDLKPQWYMILMLIFFWCEHLSIPDKSTFGDVIHKHLNPRLYSILQPIKNSLTYLFRLASPLQRSFEVFSSLFLPHCNLLRLWARQMSLYWVDTYATFSWSEKQAWTVAIQPSKTSKIYNIEFHCCNHCWQTGLPNITKINSHMYETTTHFSIAGTVEMLSKAL